MNIHQICNNKNKYTSPALKVKARDVENNENVWSEITSFWGKVLLHL